MFTPAKQLIMSGRWFKNSCPNGSFENSFTGWTKSTSSLIRELTGIVKHGIKCFGTTQDASTTAYVWRDIVFPTGHKIYIAAWAYIENWTSGVICVSARDYGVFTGAVEAAANTGIVGQWQLLSTIKTVSNGGIRLLAGRPGLGIENSRFDCVTAIDLTAEFGTGNEPTKTWCDANIMPFIIW